MRKQMIYDVVPMQLNGETIYMETPFTRLGLGVVSQSFVNTATSVQNLTSAAAAAVPNKPVTAQSDFSKTANVVATSAATVAAVAAVVPGVGTVVAVVAGVVAAAAALLGKVFANSKGKQLAAERGEYEKVNAQLRYENQELDAQYDATYRAIEELKRSISQLSGVPYQSTGLGLCLWDCKEEKAKLATTKEEYAVLVKAQENKTQLMAQLLDEYNKLIKGLLELKSDKSSKDWLLWILLAGVVGGAGYLLLRGKK